MADYDKLDPIKRVNEITAEIKALEKELIDIQSECQHKETHTKFDDSKTPRSYCKECDKVIGYPSDDELKNFLGNGNS